MTPTIKKITFLSSLVMVLITALILAKYLPASPAISADSSCPALNLGDLIKVNGDSKTVYTLNPNNELVYFPNINVLRTWEYSPTNYVTIGADCLESFPVPTGQSAVIQRAGTYIVKRQYGNELRAVLPGGILSTITPEAARVLYGNKKGEYVVLAINHYIWPNYLTTGQPINALEESDVRLHPGMLAYVKGRSYYVDTSNVLHEITAEGIRANNFQTRFRRGFLENVIKDMTMGSKINRALPHLLDMTQRTTENYDLTPPMPTLTGAASTNTVRVNWKAYAGSGFKKYYIVRSETNTNPKYPTDAVISSSTRINFINYTDLNLPDDFTYHYNLCVEQASNVIVCSEPITVSQSPIIPPPTTNGTVYYIRTDGGNASQCDGLENTAYPGTGTNQNCAWKHPFVALPPEGTARISGGDTLMIANGSYKMGYGASAGDEGCASAYSYDCIMAPIPSGPDASHKTLILGENWNTGCSSKPQLWGSGRPWAILDMNNKSNIELQCLEITDRSSCVEFHSGGNSCNRDSAPFGDWASTGLRASGSSNVLLKNLDIHGLAHTGIYAGRLTNWTIEDTKIQGNGWVGWDGDVDGNDSNSGTTTFKRVNIDWNGCGETYPGRLPTGCWGQSAGGYGDGLGTGATAGNWLIEDSTFLHNTSDGLDLLYHRGGGKITIRRVHAEGNAGNQIKTNGNAEITDSVIVGNCGYFQGKSFTHNVDACRALGNAMSVNMEGSTSPILIYNNSIYSEGDCALISEGGSNTITSRNNIYYAGTDYWQPFEKSCLFYTGANARFDTDYDIAFQTKDSNNYCALGSHNLCNTDPKFASIEPTSFDLRLKDSSPGINRGTTPITTIDFMGDNRTKGSTTDIGAYEMK
ncbi:MAG: right-handed parallel beta-helix repeat-containing protein [bacterium]